MVYIYELKDKVVNGMSAGRSVDMLGVDDIRVHPGDHIRTLRYSLHSS